VRCAGCGVQLTWPWPTTDELDAAYASWYRPEGGRFSGPGDAVLRLTRGTTAWTVDRIAPPGVVVDVGAGDGHLLDALRRRGRDCIGLERDADATAHPDLRDDELDELERPPGGAAAVVLWHVLEHLPEPRRAVAAAARLLRPGGVLVLACPNADSRQARAFGDRWLAWDLPRHLVHFTPRALEDGLRAEGFRIRRRGHLRAGQSVFCALHGLVGRVPGTVDLYDAIRRPDARQAPLSGARRAWTVAVAGPLLPVAALAAAGEAREGRGASIYVEAVLEGPDGRAGSR
jgi:SAM-dependent methyltransferase